MHAWHSFLMRAAGIFGFHGVRWSLRRLHCPVGRDALVLEVGAGGNPYPRSNVLLDGFEDSIERTEKDVVKDRPLVLGLCEFLPFKDKSFDFVIASHVLEHTDQPERYTSVCVCTKCNKGYPIVSGIPRMVPRNIKGANKTRIAATGSRGSCCG